MNAPYEIYSPSENPFLNYTDEELHLLFSENIQNPENFPLPEKHSEPLQDFPSSYDFRTEYPKCVLKIRDQGKCGSCWAFAAITSSAHRHCVLAKSKFYPVFSAKNEISCNKENNACNGGVYYKAWTYIRDNGVVPEKCWPYTSSKGVVGECLTKCTGIHEMWLKYKAQSIKVVGGIDGIKYELITNGPVHVGFNVYKDFMAYKSGIYQHVSGASLGGHAVVVVGYGVENGVNYWVCENSWGEGWGMNGYFKIKMGECNIDQYGYIGYPIPIF